MSEGKRTWGGRRTGAGRKKTGTCHDAPHRRRPALDPRHPVHVVLRSQAIAHWRNNKTYQLLRGVTVKLLGRADFRVCHISIQHTHIHLLVEASDRDALRRGMQSFAIRAAHALNGGPHVCGQVFAFRYHATQIRTTRHARHALAYVLNNWRRHRADQANARTLAAKLDPYATGMCFDGWAGSPRFSRPEGYEPLAVSAPETWLLRVGWRRHGAIDLFETPGPLR